MSSPALSLAKPAGWNSLPRYLKMFVLRFLTIQELRQVSGVSHEVQTMAAQIILEKSQTDASALCLSDMAVVWALQQDSFFRRMVPLCEIVPNEVTIGRQIGSGGTNTVHLVGNCSSMVIKNAGASSGTSPEYQALIKMEAIGLRTVLKDLRLVDGTIMLVMKRIEGVMDSKSIIGYQKDLKDYVDPNKQAPFPNPNLAKRIRDISLQYLLEAWDQMASNDTSFGDFQFLLDPKGEVYMNDPTESKAGTDSGTKVIIQAMIDTYEFTFHPRARGLSWMAFKQLKRALHIARMQTLGRGYRGCTPPVFCLLDFAFNIFNDLPRCVLFLGQERRDVDGFRCIALARGFGYLPTDTLEMPDKKDWTWIYKKGT